MGVVFLIVIIVIAVWVDVYKRQVGWFHCHTVYHDNTGRIGTFENGLPGTSYSDCDPECSKADPEGCRSDSGYAENQL